MKTNFGRERILKTIDKGEGSDHLSKRFDFFIMALIVLNVAAVILETVETIRLEYESLFYYFELFSVFIFSVEYLIRIWTCTLIPQYSHPFWGRLKYVFSIGAIIDLLAVLPFYLPFFMVLDARFLRVLRLFRLMRIFKLGRYSTAFQMIVRVFKNRREELAITVTLLFVVLILSSSLMYYIESEAQPDVFTSIPATMWWGVATLTTVGYGDVYPITALGKLLGAFIAVLGIGVFALPAGIIASSFEAEIKKRNNEFKVDEDEP